MVKTGLAKIVFAGKNRFLLAKIDFLTIFSILFTMNLHILLSIYCQRLCDSFILMTIHVYLLAVLTIFQSLVTRD